MNPIYYIYMHAFSRRFYPKRLTLHVFCQYVCSLGIEPTTFCAANAMLYHWATGTLIYYDTRPNSFSTDYFDRGYSPRWVFWNHFVCIFVLYVSKRFETRLSARAQNTARCAEFGSFTSFCVCMFKLRLVFVRSDTGGREGELGSVLLSVRRGSLRVHWTRRASTQMSFSESCVWML